MTDFHVFPAIDMRGGRCVRLRQGDATQETVFLADPAEAARRWQDQGAHWLHVVNLDGALDSHDAPAGANLEAFSRIMAAASVPVQFGGGIRTFDAIRLVLDLGAARAILGTVALTDQALVQRALTEFGPERVVVSLDARDGLVRTHGWQQGSDRTTVDAGRQLAGLGVRIAVHTDISRDAMLSGANVISSSELARKTGLGVIVSGGVASVGDVRAAAADPQLMGVITGQALYTGVLHLPDAIAAAQQVRQALPPGAEYVG